MKAIYKRPQEPAKIIDIDNSLDAPQGAVDGYIETLTFATDACVICNEEGRIKGMGYNVHFCGLPLFGPLLVVGIKGDEFTSLENAEHVMRLLFGGKK